MFFVRLTILTLVVLALVPRDPESTQRLAEQFATAKTWAATSCERHQEACETASGVWSELVSNAQHNAGLLFGAAHRQFQTSPDVHRGMPTYFTNATHHEPQITPVQRIELPKLRVFSEGAAYPEPLSPSPREKGTLTFRDLQPPWRGDQP